MKNKKGYPPLWLRMGFVIIMVAAALAVISCEIWGIVSFIIQRSWGGVIFMTIVLIIGLLPLILQISKEGWKPMLSDLRKIVTDNGENENS